MLQHIVLRCPVVVVRNVARATTGVMSDVRDLALPVGIHHLLHLLHLTCTADEGLVPSSACLKPSHSAGPVEATLSNH